MYSHNPDSKIGRVPEEIPSFPIVDDVRRFNHSRSTRTRKYVQHDTPCYQDVMEAYKTPRPMMQIRDAFVRGFIWTFHSIGTGKAAKSKSVTIFRAWRD
jgi:hypothetical protein